MSNYTHKPGTGVLFKNDKKTSANQPDMTGAGADESGNQIRIAAWTKEGKNGVKYLSWKISPMQDSNTNNEPERGNDLPF
jgi:hypothetical protein